MAQPRNDQSTLYTAGIVLVIGVIGFLILNFVYTPKTQPGHVDAEPSDLRSVGPKLEGDVIRATEIEELIRRDIKNKSWNSENYRSINRKIRYSADDGILKNNEEEELQTQLDLDYLEVLNSTAKSFFQTIGDRYEFTELFGEFKRFVGKYPGKTEKMHEVCGKYSNLMSLAAASRSLARKGAAEIDQALLERRIRSLISYRKEPYIGDEQRGKEIIDEAQNLLVPKLVEVLREDLVPRVQDYYKNEEYQETKTEQFTKEINEILSHPLLRTRKSSLDFARKELSMVEKHTERDEYFKVKALIRNRALKGECNAAFYPFTFYVEGCKQLIDSTNINDE